MNQNCDTAGHETFIMCRNMETGCLQQCRVTFVCPVISITQQHLTLKFVNLPRCGPRGNYICRGMTTCQSFYLSGVRLLNLIRASV